MAPKEGFYKKEEVPEDTRGLLQITDDVVFVPTEKDLWGTAFFTPPRFEDFLKYLNVRYFYRSHVVFNRLGLSTQVPAKISYLLEKELPKLLHDFKFCITEVSTTKEIFDKFTIMEYYFVESLARMDHIIYDGYFKNRLSLVRGIFKLMEKHDVDEKKVVEQALLENPEIKPFLPKPWK